MASRYTFAGSLLKILGFSLAHRCTMIARTVEPLSHARTPLEELFSILPVFCL